MTSFAELRDSFWCRGSTYGVQPQLTDEAVTGAERILGVSLPACLIDLLRIQNGGAVASCWHKFPTSAPTSWAPGHVEFAALAGIGEASGISLLDSPYLVKEWGLPEPVVALCGDGHWWIALDYRLVGLSGEPSVTWFDTEVGEDLALAPNFRAFVECLTD
ncbi:SMI1/KNR4 family protein [Antrihabitans spumae]|uniref:SMI1/KNR4 family protein n=1 Tax=Antrihabitans spumae TaxID=3373370 RepID=A0ABW7KZQ4_9NOCA